MVCKGCVTALSRVVAEASEIPLFALSVLRLRYAACLHFALQNRLDLMRDRLALPYRLLCRLMGNLSPQLRQTAVEASMNTPV
jgi:hypothetical protein